jgi:DNA-binding MarR family transcriptional regulator
MAASDEMSKHAHIHEPSDEVDEVVAAWKRERPDLDLSAIAVAGRLGRLALRFGPAQDRTLAKFGLQNGGFDVLATLRRSGEPYRLTPSVLSDQLMLSRAGMTSRLDKLEEAGLVARSLDPEDRRSFHVELTAAGLAVVDEAMTEHTANVTRLLSVVTPTELAALGDTLRKLLRQLE